MTAQRQFLTRPTFIFAVALMLRLATCAIFLHGGHQRIDNNADETEGYEAMGIAQSLASGNGFSHSRPTIEFYP